MASSLTQFFQARLAARETSGLKRVLKTVPAGLTDFASNDYLGLTHHPRVIAAMAQATMECGAGAGASALIAGHSDRHASAERALATWKGTEAAVLLPSGYQAGHAAVQTIAAVAKARGTPVSFLLDRLAHASLIDAIRGSGMPFRVFVHNDLLKLARLLEEANGGQLQVVVTESIFSMDGDAAPLRALADLKQKHRFVLLLDEAHGSGVYGPGGAGLAAELHLTGAVDIFTRDDNVARTAAKMPVLPDFTGVFMVKGNRVMRCRAAQGFLPLRVGRMRAARHQHTFLAIAEFKRQRRGMRACIERPGGCATGIHHQQAAPDADAFETGIGK